MWHEGGFTDLQIYGIALLLALVFLNSEYKGNNFYHSAYLSKEIFLKAEEGFKKLKMHAQYSELFRHITRLKVECAARGDVVTVACHYT
jgi:hypothetical protein